MTSSAAWNPSEVVMVQALVQGGSTAYWKRQVSKAVSTQRYEYMDADSDNALLDSVEPSLVHLGKLLTQSYVLQVDTTAYEQQDVPSRRTFVSSERHEKVSAEILTDLVSDQSEPNVPCA
jgi:hypothetical protein